MIENSHILSDKTDEYFLSQHKMDEYLLAEFKPGDTIVQCGKCHRVWLVETWKIKGECPNDQCRHKKTEVFVKKKNRVQEHRGARIHIVKNENSGFSAVEEKTDEISRNMGKLLEKIHKLFFTPLRKMIKIIFTITLITAMALTLIQFQQKESPINGRNGIYYQKKIVESAEKAEKTCLEVFEKNVNAATDMIEKVVDSVEDSVIKVKKCNKKMYGGK